MRLYKQITAAKRLLTRLNRKYKDLLIDPPAEGTWISMPYTDEMEMLVLDLNYSTVDLSLRRTAKFVLECHHKLNATLDSEYIKREHIYLYGNLVKEAINVL